MSGATPRIVAITGEAELKRSVQRLSSATGEEVSIISDAGKLDPATAPALIFYDVRSIPKLDGILARIPATSKVIFMTNEATLMGAVPLLNDSRAVSLVAYDARFDAIGFLAAAAKVLRGEIFGVQKYFSWGVHTEEVIVRTYEEKSAAIERLKEFARVAGYRGPVRERILGVADELLMNALYHAPVDERGKPLYKEVPRGEMSRVPLAAPVIVQYASDGKSFALGVRDRFGSVNRDLLVSYLARAAAGEAQIEQKTSGAGLGIATVLRSASRLAFNLAHGSSLEVLALFDYEVVGTHASAIHVFTPGAPLSSSASRAAAAPVDLPAADEPVEPVAASSAGTVLLTVILTFLLTVGGAYFGRAYLIDYFCR